METTGHPRRQSENSKGVRLEVVRAAPASTTAGQTKCRRSCPQQAGFGDCVAAELTARATSGRLDGTCAFFFFFKQRSLPLFLCDVQIVIEMCWLRLENLSVSIAHTQNTQFKVNRAISHYHHY